MTLMIIPGAVAEDSDSKERMLKSIFSLFLIFKKKKIAETEDLKSVKKIEEIMNKK